MSNFAVGDLVVLNSGSLPMTLSYMEAGQIWADYWDGDKIERYIGNARMFKKADNSISHFEAVSLVSQRRVQLTKDIGRK